MLPTRERSSSVPLPLTRTHARPASAPTPSTAVRTTSSSSASRSRLEATASPRRRIEDCTRPRSWVSSAEAPLELARHLVELLAERGELVAAGGRHLRGEVAGGELAGGGEKARDLALQRARDEHRAGDRQQEEAEQDDAGERAVAPSVVLRVGRHRAEREDADLLAAERVGVREAAARGTRCRRASASSLPASASARDVARRQRAAQHLVAVERRPRAARAARARWSARVRAARTSGRR